MEFNNEDIIRIKYMYRELNMKQSDIAKEFNCDRRKISKYLKDVKKLYEDRDWLYQKYVIENIPKSKICELANCSESSIRKYTNLYGFEINQYSYRHRKYDYNEDYFENIDTENKAYWLGFIMADGCITNKVGTEKYKMTSEIRLTFNLSIVDKNHLELFCKEISNGLNVKEHTTYLKATDKKYEMCSLRVYNKKIVNDLIKLGVKSRKSLNEVFPNIPSTLYKHFIRGYFDGDGCFSYWYSNDGRLHCKVDFISGKNLSDSLKEIIEKELDIYISQTNNSRNKKLYNTITTNSNSVKLMNWIYKDSHIHLDRKYIKFQEYLNCKDIV